MSEKILKPTTRKIYRWKNSYFVHVLSSFKLQEQIPSKLAASLSFDMFASCKISILLRVFFFYF